MTWLFAHLEGVLAGALAGLVALGWIARRVPALGVAIGVVLVTAAVVLVLMFDRRWFQSEGSAAGLFVFAIYAAVVASLASLGLGFLGTSLARIARGADGKRNYARAAMIGLGVPLAMAVTAHLGAIVYILWLPSMNDDPPSGPTLVSRRVSVQDEYPVAWQSRTGATALSLVAQAADFPLAPNEREVRVEETADGPRVLELEVPAVEAEPVALRLHRHDGTVEHAFFRSIDGKAGADRAAVMPAAFWVERNDGRWKFLGVACDGSAGAGCFMPEAPLARWMPMLFGLQRVAVHARARPGGGCEMAFRYEGRMATASTREACASPASVAALAPSIDTLARIVADARQRPDAAERKRRELAAIERCEAAARAMPAVGRQPEPWRVARARAEGLCDQAQRLAMQRLRSNPGEAAPFALRAMQAKVALDSTTRFDAAQEVAEALAAAGPKHPDAVRAQVLRAASLRARGPRGTANATLDAVVPVAAEVLPPDDPSLEHLARLGSDDLDEPAKLRYLAMLATRHSRALAGGASTPLEMRTRYELCRRRTSWNLERETLKDCADKLAAAWNANPAADPFDRPAYVAMGIGRMYQSYAWAANDFAGGAADVRALRDQAATRLPPSPEREAALGSLGDIEAELAAKGASRPARGSR